MMRISETISKKEKGILNVYFTAGYPKLESTTQIIEQLELACVDLIEIGMPFSDPLADGPIIQRSSEIALHNGMTISILFEQLSEIKKTNNVPLILMGYYNQLLQFGIENFLIAAQEVNVKGLIIPDLPMEIYEKEYKDLFAKYNIEISFLITPTTSLERMHKAVSLSSAFVYIVAQSSITGKSSIKDECQLAYFKKCSEICKDVQSLIGFGISDKADFNTACKYSNGAIIGSAFISVLGKEQNFSDSILHFINSLK